MAKKQMTYTELQEFVRKQVGIYEASGSDGIYKIVDRLCRENLKNGKGTLPDRYQIHKETMVSLRQVDQYLLDLVTEGKLRRLKVHNRRAVWFPNTPEYTGE